MAVGGAVGAPGGGTGGFPVAATGGGTDVAEMGAAPSGGTVGTDVPAAAGGFSLKVGGWVMPEAGGRVVAMGAELPVPDEGTAILGFSLNAGGAVTAADGVAAVSPAGALPVAVAAAAAKDKGGVTVVLPPDAAEIAMGGVSAGAAPADFGLSLNPPGAAVCRSAAGVAAGGACATGPSVTSLGLSRILAVASAGAVG
ncbi:MAG: hypothetical protein WCL04_10650 [Verrucomicrobiota bacterium]